MPLYEYRCRNCDHQFEIQQAVTEDALTVCPECEGALRKVFSPVGIAFKGSGFYKNDSRSSGSVVRLVGRVLRIGAPGVVRILGVRRVVGFERLRRLRRLRVQFVELRFQLRLHGLELGVRVGVHTRIERIQLLGLSAAGGSGLLHRPRRLDPRGGPVDQVVQQRDEHHLHRLPRPGIRADQRHPLVERQRLAHLLE